MNLGTVPVVLGGGPKLGADRGGTERIESDGRDTHGGPGCDELGEKKEDAIVKEKGAARLGEDVAAAVES
jgi:hypothetical protein